MKFNIISNLRENDGVESCNNFNTVVAYHLKEALGDARLVNDVQLLTEKPLEADHTIVISAKAIGYIHKISNYLQQIREATEGKVTVYLDAAWLDYDKLFDLVFTVIKPFPRRSAKYVYVGWGANPQYCYPEQTEKTVYLDTLMYGFYKRRFNALYTLMEKVLSTSNVKVHHPIPRYDTGQRIAWRDNMKLMRKCHFYCCTQLCESDLLRIEAAYCGALLVVPKPLYRYRTMASLEHAIWTDEKELREILKLQTNPMEISRKAHVHTWDKVAERILAKL